ncbi:hypothetical protein N9E76_00535 [bacterium]|nr:hypothetical protein [bacterium]
MTRLHEALTLWSNKTDAPNSLCSCAGNVRTHFINETVRLDNLYKEYTGEIQTHNNSPNTTKITELSWNDFNTILAHHAPTIYLMRVAKDQTDDNLELISRNDLDIMQACFIYSVPTYMEKYHTTWNIFYMLSFGMYFLALSATLYASVDSGPYATNGNLVLSPNEYLSNPRVKKAALGLLNLTLFILVFVYVLTPGAQETLHLDETKVASLAFRDSAVYTKSRFTFWQWALATLIVVQFCVEAFSLAYPTFVDNVPDKGLVAKEKLLRKKWYAFLRTIRCDLSFIIGSCMVIVAISMTSGEHNLHSLMFSFAAILSIAFLQHLSHICRLSLRWIKFFQNTTNNGGNQKFDEYFTLIRNTRVYIFFGIIFVLYAFVYQSSITKVAPTLLEVYSHNVMTWSWLLFLSITVLPDILCEIHRAWLDEDATYSLMKVVLICTWVAYLIYTQIKGNILAVQLASSAQNFVTAS